MINMKDIAKPFGSQGFLVGIGVAALAYFLTPQLKQSMRPAAVKGTQGVMMLGSKTKQLMEDGREKISHLISEKTEGTQEKIRNVVEEAGISSTVLKELIEEREASNKIMQELKDSILSLKEEISHMKPMDTPQEG